MVVQVFKDIIVCMICSIINMDGMTLFYAGMRAYSDLPR